MFDTLLLGFQQSTPFYLVTVFVVSLMVGSFLNVVIFRLPKMMENEWRNECQQFLSPEGVSDTPTEATFNLLIPHSHCPHCGNPIKVWQNIPVVSFLFLKGRCGHCGTAISLRYPAIELLTALASTWVAFHYGANMQGLAAIIVTWALVCLIFIDIDHMLLPDQITLGLLWGGLFASVFTIFIDAPQAIMGAVIGYMSLWSVYWLFKMVTGKEGMGHGDFKLLAALGAFTGWQGIPVIILASSLVGATVGIVLMFVRRQGSNLAIPFGPYLAIAGWITLLYQTTIVEGYWQWIGAH